MTGASSLNEKDAGHPRSHRIARLVGLAGTCTALLYVLLFGIAAAF